MSHGNSRGQTGDNFFCNTRNCGRVCLFSQNKTTIFAKCIVRVSTSLNVGIACCEDMYGRYCILKRNNDHLDSLFAIIVFKGKGSSFSVV